MIDADYIWPSPSGHGWVDAWNGWYETEAEARGDGAAGVGRPWILRYGEDVIAQDEAEQRARIGKLLLATTSHELTTDSERRCWYDTPDRMRTNPTCIGSHHAHDNHPHTPGCDRDPKCQPATDR